MLESKPTQFTLSPEGKILWQEKLNNPLPGIEVASLTKGQHPLKPGIVISQTIQTAAVDQQRLQDSLSLWLNMHFSAILEPLILLGIKPESENAEEDHVAQISQKIYDGLGIVPREELESHIEKLDAEKRGVLRNKKIRLGPVLVFIPSLNKPAAVRLRGLLWSLFNDQPLPAKVPADGIVSQKVEAENASEAFYRSIGYPLYGGRAVRIDMLDRVISSIYDNAKDGMFEARHEMAEWLGTPIEDLYKILESMGHKKIEEQPVPEKPEEQNREELKPEEPASDTPKPEEKKEAVAKPALAKFRLKRGKAFQKNAPRPERKSFTKTADTNQTKPERKKFNNEDKKPFEKNKAHKDKKLGHKKREDKPNRREARVVFLESKKREEDSPFAILQQLIVKSDG